MNKIYRTVWSESTQSWVAVSEVNLVKGKKSRSLKAGVITAGATVIPPFHTSFKSRG